MSTSTERGSATPRTEPSSFKWYELMTTDTDAAITFYRRVIGWEAKDSGLPGPAYTILSVGASGVGGVLRLTQEMCEGGACPCWVGYIAVDDVDAYAARVTAAGGKVIREPADIAGVLRFAVVADPYGAAFVLFRGMSPQAMVPATAGMQGTIGWHELHAGDGVGAFAFYSRLFGWTKADTLDMGPMGVYQTFAAGGEAVGGMMTRVPEMPATTWLYYIYVDGIDAAVARATEAGGKLLMGPHPVPGGQWIAQLLDPQGAMFAMMSKQR
jgi:predicted enzyme related to lactoylglutathione lyase